MFGSYLNLALRSFERNKALTVLMVLAIALGIGASMTTLTVFHVLSGDPLPQKSEQLFYVQLDPETMQGYRPGEEFRPPPDFGRGGPGAQEFDFEEIFGGAGGGSGGFSDFFEGLFGRRGRAEAPSQRGPQGPRDSRAKLAVPLQAVHDGGSVRVNVNGRQLDVRVPTGVKPGQVIRLAGQGSQGGNLLLEVEYAPHPQFEVDGRNIIHVLSLTPWQAALGATLSVPTLGGAVDLKIPPDSDTGRKLRLRGRGLPGTPPGDQIVELEVTAPRADTDEQRKAYAALGKAFGNA